MSKGFGAIQEKILTYFEKYIYAKRVDVVEAFPEHNRGDVYKSIKTLICKHKILIPVIINYGRYRGSELLILNNESKYYLRSIERFRIEK